MVLIPADVKRKAIGYMLLAVLAALVTVVIVFWAIVVMVAVIAFWALVAVAAIQLARLVVWFIRLPRSAKAHVPAAVWAWLSWPWLCRQLGLAVTDRQAADTGQRRARHPKTRIRPAAHGLTVHMRTVPGVGRKELEDAAVHLADHWRCARVQVGQPSPGRLIVRGLRQDPLDVPLSAAEVLPPVFDGRHVVLMRDEWGELRSADLANLSGSVISGNPGRGKTESALSLAMQLVPSPLVDTHIFDGGGGLDWSPFAPAVAMFTDDDRAAAVERLEALVGLMMDRRRNLEADRGVRNGWKAGATPDCRIQWVLIDEAHWFLDLEGSKGDPVREKQVKACRSLVAQLMRQGRAAMFHTTLICLKATGGGGLPPDIRDLAGLRWCFGVATTEVAVGGLGDDIRRYETLSPVLLQGDEHVGVATVLMKTGQLPYTLGRFPAVGEELMARAIDAKAVPVAVPDDASALVS